MNAFAAPYVEWFRLTIEHAFHGAHCVSVSGHPGSVQKPPAGIGVFRRALEPDPRRTRSSAARRYVPIVTCARR